MCRKGLIYRSQFGRCLPNMIFPACIFTFTVFQFQGPTKGHHPWTLLRPSLDPPSGHSFWIQAASGKLPSFLSTQHCPEKYCCLPLTFPCKRGIRIMENLTHFKRPWGSKANCQSDCFPQEKVNQIIKPECNLSDYLSTVKSAEFSRISWKTRFI